MVGLVQRDDVAIAALPADRDRSADFRPQFEADAPIRDLQHLVRPTLASPLDGAQEGFEMGIEGCSSRLIVWPVFGLMFTPVFYVVVRWLSDARKVKLNSVSAALATT